MHLLQLFLLVVLFASPVLSGNDDDNEDNTTKQSAECPLEEEVSL